MCIRGSEMLMRFRFMNYRSFLGKRRFLFVYPLYYRCVTAKGNMTLIKERQRLAVEHPKSVTPNIWESFISSGKRHRFPDRLSFVKSLPSPILLKVYLLNKEVNDIADAMISQWIKQGLIKPKKENNVKRN